MQKNVAGQLINAEMVSATDGSAFTGTVTVYVTGGSGSQTLGSVGSGICTHKGNGLHQYAPAQAETNYDLIAFTFSGTGAVPCTVQVYTRVDANATFWGGTAVASANVLIDGAITAAKIASDAITAAKIQDAALTAAKFASGAFDAVWSVATRLLTAGTNIVLAKGTGVTGFNDLDAAGVRTAVGLGSANLDTQLSGINSKTTNLPSDPADASDIAAAFGTVNSTLGTIAGYIDTEVAALASELAKVPKSDGTATWNNTALASIQSEANDAIVANHLDHLLAADYDPASKPGVSTALLNELIGNDGGVSQFTANALENAPQGEGGGGGGCPTVEEIVAALSGRTIVIQSPLDGTKVTLYAEAEYESGTQRLVVTNSTGAGWPNGATWNSVKFVARTNGTETSYGTGAWIVESGAGAQVAISFTSEEMAALQLAAGQNDACAVWAYKSGDATSRFPLLAEGKLRMVDVPWA